jgi:hypothetical protein
MSMVLLGAYALATYSCATPQPSETGWSQGESASPPPANTMATYATFALQSDLSKLDEQERLMLPLLIEASKSMDKCFWLQAYGERRDLYLGMEDESLRSHVDINYGPWDRLNDNQSFVPGIGPKPLGANFYPPDMTREEFESAVAQADDGGEALKSLYTMVRRNAEGNLYAIPYHEFFAVHVKAAAAKLREAASLASDPELQVYLQMRARALETSKYHGSDLAWMDMKNNGIDIVIGPIETYEDRVFGYKAAFEAYVLIKDKAWSERLSKYAALLPDLQKALPCAPEYKQEEPGTDSDLNAYDIVYCAGDCNAGSKTIAINLPNDERVQLKKGTRRLQLKNAMRAKYDKILEPIADLLIDEDQRRHVTFEAFFGNTMFHEVAHGLGIKNTITGKGSVREALKDQSSALEEGKADILGLFMVTKLIEDGVLTDGEVMDNYVTFLAGIFRSVRFGAASAHGRANMLRFNYFEKMGAFERDPDSGTYSVNFAKMQQAMRSLSAKILKLQGDGDYEGTSQLMEEVGKVGEQLQQDLDRVNAAGIPVDIVFEQGMDILAGK